MGLRNVTGYEHGERLSIDANPPEFNVIASTATKVKVGHCQKHEYEAHFETRKVQKGEVASSGAAE